MPVEYERIPFILPICLSCPIGGWFESYEELANRLVVENFERGGAAFLQLDGIRLPPSSGGRFFVFAASGEERLAAGSRDPRFLGSFAIVPNRSGMVMESMHGNVRAILNVTRKIPMLLRSPNARLIVVYGPGRGQSKGPLRPFSAQATSARLLLYPRAKAG